MGFNGRWAKGGKTNELKALIRRAQYLAKQDGRVWDDLTVDAWGAYIDRARAERAEQRKEKP